MTDLRILIIVRLLVSQWMQLMIFFLPHLLPNISSTALFIDKDGCGLNLNSNNIIIMT